MSRIKGTKTMEFRQLIEDPLMNIYLKYYAEQLELSKEIQAENLVPEKRQLYQAKESGLQLDFNVFQEPSNQHKIETICLKLYTID